MRRLFIRSIPLLLGIAAFGLSWKALRVPPAAHGLQVVFDLRTDLEDDHVVYWGQRPDDFTEERSVRVHVEPDRDLQEVVFDLPGTVERFSALRFDPGDLKGEIELRAIVLRGPYREVRYEGSDILDHFQAANDVRELHVDSLKGTVPVLVNGPDPSLTSTVDLTDDAARALDPERPVLRPFILAILLGILVHYLTSLWMRARPVPSPGRHDRTKGPGRRVLLPLLVGLLTFFVSFGLADNISFRDRALYVEFLLTATHTDNFQVFFADKPGAFGRDDYVNQPVHASPRRQLLSFRMPQDTLFSYLRFDPGNAQDSLTIERMRLQCSDQVVEFNAKDLKELFKANEQVSDLRVTDKGLCMQFTGDDPFLFSDDDLGPEVTAIWERSGNGPWPAILAAIIAMLVFFGLYFRPPGPVAALRGSRTELVLSGLFVMLIALPLLSGFLPIQPQLPNTEKRPLAEHPLLRLHSLFGFGDRYTKYYGDHFGFRKSLFRLNALFHAYVLHDSPMPDNLVFGKDGYLFLIRPGVVDQYRGRRVFTDQELHWIAERLEKRRKWLAERGTSYYLMFPPYKASIYPDKLPDPIHRVDDHNGLDQLIDFLREHTGIPVIDPRADLSKARGIRDVYFTTDIHWNPWGGFIGYQDLMERMVQDHPELGSPCTPEDYIVEADTNDQGDLAMQMALNDRFTRITYMMAPLNDFRARSLPEEELPGSAFFKYRPVFMQGPDDRAPRLLMFRDSFAVYLIPYLSEHFSRSVYVWSPVFIPDIVEREQPDIVVQEILEVFIRDLLEDKVRDDI
ncbi:MAG: hypothetical protein H6595_03110 [Flavobacteriales bacterium]|nr:hypothetical protein [Flavobacteriales bacterium]